MEGYEQSSVNAIEQARPVIMVLPSDNVLKRNHALSTQTVGGREVVVRNYQQNLLAAADNKSLPPPSETPLSNRAIPCKT